SSIACLVYAVARRKDLKPYKATLDYLKQRLEQTSTGYPEYTRYYQAQALFQGDLLAWEKWNNLLIRQLKQAQRPDGSFQGSYAPARPPTLSPVAGAQISSFLPLYKRWGLVARKPNGGSSRAPSHSPPATRVPHRCATTADPLRSRPGSFGSLGYAA